MAVKVNQPKPGYRLQVAENTQQQQQQNNKSQKLFEEQLNQFIARLAEQKYTMVTPNAFDEDILKIVPNLRILQPNTNIIALQTSIRDR